ncbi:protein adenylyltransferase SelO [Falsirhodobacter halotolerans]|uniref:protein adenylyltransferase SelO n=1 Tax=Falsirhodobacter halotolerans TaxID=1146892 RepID=UPI001FD2127A|nr:YdiU family protein [Falsirhodobacter halotolerans]MCJ8140227.1 YdiU family protein [Falsirhodobacter halotolerans]
MTQIRLTHHYADALPDLVTPWQGANVPGPKILRMNRALADRLGLADASPQMLAGMEVPEGAHPVAQVYAGHQFGGYSPRLGDGRALLLGEVARDGVLTDVALKGSGRTPYSRGADGKAALGPVLREYLMAQAMTGLGIPTTGALAVVTTGESVWREDGPLPGAILVRTAASHLRVGTFQYAAANGDVQALADYAIARHYPHRAGDYAGFFADVAARQAELIAKWMLVGFVHGVMNTDNMTISGETIDYGPCAFMEAYAPGVVFSSIDRQGRYAYGHQPMILGWNLARLAEAILPLIDTDESQAIARATGILEGVAAQYQAAWLSGMRAKLGLAGEETGDLALAEDFLRGIEGADWTLSFRDLGRDMDGFRSRLMADGWLEGWLPRWQARQDDGSANRMRAANPLFIPRNHRVEEALAAAHAGDMGPFDRLTQVLQRPFDDQPEHEALAQPAPADFGPYRTFCGT